jgi:hypothetical protein
MGFVEAATAIASGREERVLMVYADAPLEPPFEVLVEYEPPLAGAFLLTSAVTDLSLALSMAPKGQGNRENSPHFLQFMKFILDPDHKPLKLDTDRLTWTWTRSD